MKKSFLLLAASLLIAGVGCNATKPTTDMNNTQPQTNASQSSNVGIAPISHATAVLAWGGKIIYTDPTGGKDAFAGQPAPDLILVTDIHGDHLSTSTLAAVATANTVIVMPRAVKDLVTVPLPGTTVVLKNDETTTQQGFAITGVPMYNFPGENQDRHTKGRGNGYVIELNGERVYIAGDTAGTPEMRALKDIDIAFVPMNLPYTMGVEEAADAVLAFKPKKVIPYHYRGPDGLADTAKFRDLVNAGDPDITVDLMNFYPTP